MQKSQAGFSLCALYKKGCYVTFASYNVHLSVERGTGGCWGEFKLADFFYCSENCIFEPFMNN